MDYNMEQVTITKERLDYLEKCTKLYNEIAFYLEDEFLFDNENSTIIDAILNLLQRYHERSMVFYENKIDSRHSNSI